MNDAWIIGAFSTVFGKWPDKSFKELTQEAYLGALADASFCDGMKIGSAWFANSGMEVWGQTSIRGQVCLAPLQKEGLFPAHAPVTNVENACASGSTALHGAWKDILSGQVDLSLAIGVEKLHFPNVERGKVLEGFAAGIDNFDREEWVAQYRGLPGGHGADVGALAGRSVFVEACAARARWHMSRYGTTIEQIAAACSKSHWYGARNPRAQYQFEIPASVVLRDRMVSAPLTRAMCASPGDGAAAILVCSAKLFPMLPPAVQKRAVRVRANVLAGAAFRTCLEDSPVARIAAERAYQLAGLAPDNIHVAELHDSTSFCEIELTEALGFCRPGEGGAFAASGATGPGGRVPVNVSGGLVSKSHPVAATGLSMTLELVEQLRGEAGERQVKNASVGLLYNGGGAIGLDDAVGAVTILQSCA